MCEKLTCVHWDKSFLFCILKCTSIRPFLSIHFTPAMLWQPMYIQWHSSYFAMAMIEIKINYSSKAIAHLHLVYIGERLNHVIREGHTRWHNGQLRYYIEYKVNCTWTINVAHKVYILIMQLNIDTHVKGKLKITNDLSMYNLGSDVFLHSVLFCSQPTGAWRHEELSVVWQIHGLKRVMTKPSFPPTHQRPHRAS